MGRRQQHLYRLEPSQLPPDFADRLNRLREAAGLSWRALARLLRVHVRSVHRWRNGAQPDAGHLFSLMELAVELDLLHHLLPMVGQRECARTSRAATTVESSKSDSRTTQRSE